MKQSTTEGHRRRVDCQNFKQQLNWLTRRPDRTKSTLQASQIRNDAVILAERAQETCSRTQNIYDRQRRRFSPYAS